MLKKKKFNTKQKQPPKLTWCSTCRFHQSEGWPEWLAGWSPMQCSHSAFDEMPLMTEKLNRGKLIAGTSLHDTVGQIIKAIWMSLIQWRSCYPPVYDRPVTLHRPLQTNKTLLISSDKLIQIKLLISSDKNGNSMYWTSSHSHTFTEGWWAIPLRGVSWDTVDDDFPNELVALIAEET